MTKDYQLKYSNQNVSSFSRKRDFKKKKNNLFVKNPHAANSIVVNHFISRRLRKNYYLT